MRFSQLGSEKIFEGLFKERFRLTRLEKYLLWFYSVLLMVLLQKTMQRQIVAIKHVTSGNLVWKNSRSS